MDPTEIITLLSNFELQPPNFREAMGRFLLEQRTLYQDETLADGALSTAEQRGSVGMAGGWVSFAFFQKLLRQYGVDWTDNRASEYLLSRGFIRHPGLPSGRTNNPVRPDNNKTRLYVRPDHHSVTLRRARDVERAYSRDQGFIE